MTTEFKRRQERRATAANWSSTNPILAAGELGYDTTNDVLKIGDGSTAWNSLGVANSGTYAPKAADVVVTYTGGTLTLNNTAWTDLDSSGSAAARNLDLLIPAEAGDLVHIEPSFVVAAAATDLFFDVATVVAGAVVNTFSGTPNGIGGWFCPTSVGIPVSGAVYLTVQAGDIDNGNVRCRLRFKTGSATNRQVFGSLTQWPLKIGGGNAGPPA